jgi:nicotinamide mononucleotide (NMN) deamidase PncC
VLPTPNDTTWATAITGVVGPGGMLSTGLTALRLERRRVHAEDEQLRQQHGKEQRKERGSAYYRAIVLLKPPRPLRHRLST